MPLPLFSYMCQMCDKICKRKPVVESPELVKSVADSPDRGLVHDLAATAMNKLLVAITPLGNTLLCLFSFCWGIVVCFR